MSALPGTGKIGFATAKKIGCHARRNQIRRRFQAALSGFEFSPNPPLDLIVIIGIGATGVEFAEVKEELLGLLKKIEGRWASESECS